MAALTSEEQLELRSMLARVTAQQHWNKAQVNTAIQAIEDLMQQPATRTNIANAIETAVPGKFDGNEKQLLFSAWSVTYARRQVIF